MFETSENGSREKNADSGKSALCLAKKPEQGDGGQYRSKKKRDAGENLDEKRTVFKNDDERDHLDEHVSKTTVAKNAIVRDLDILLHGRALLFCPIAPETQSLALLRAERKRKNGIERDVDFRGRVIVGATKNFFVEFFVPTDARVKPRVHRVLARPHPAGTKILILIPLPLPGLHKKIEEKFRLPFRSPPAATSAST